MSSNTDFRTKNEIIISINADADGGAAGGSDAAGAGVIPPRRRRKFPARRTSGGLISFYDLGQLKNDGGAFIDLDFTHSTGIPPENTPPEPLPDAEYMALQAQLFARPISEWSSVYRKLEFETADKTGLSVIAGQPFENRFSYRLHPENPLWSRGGLKVADKIRVAGAAVRGFDLTNPANTRVYDSLEPDAAPVELEIFTSAEIFLVPSICYRFAASAFGILGGRLYANYGLISRLFLDVTTIDNDNGVTVAQPAFLQNDYDGFASVNPLFGQFRFPEAGTIEYYRAMTPYLYFLITGVWANYPGTVHLSEGEPASPSAFPPDNSSGLYFFLQSARFQSENFHLSAVIKTGGKIYYVKTSIVLGDSNANQIFWQFQFSRFFN